MTAYPTSVSPSQKTLCVLKEGDLYQILPLEDEDIRNIHPNILPRREMDKEGAQKPQDGQIGLDFKRSTIWLGRRIYICIQSDADDQGLRILSASGPFAFIPNI